MVRRIAVVGAGQAGLLLALGLQRHGCEPAVITDRTAEEIRTGRVLSNQCMFDEALRHERSQGLNFWDGTVPPVNGIRFTAGEPGRAEPAIQWESTLDEPAQSVDQRVKMSDWLTEFARRGGEVRHGRVDSGGLEGLAREFELVLVAAGSGSQFGRLFPSRPELSPFTSPQRALGLMYLADNRADYYQGVTFGLATQGEWFSLPVLTASGPGYGVYISGRVGGPLDCWNGVEDASHFHEIARKVAGEHFPWLAPMLDDTSIAHQEDFLKGRVTPVVRDPVGVLDSGAKVLAMGDTAVTNDPIAGQGANMAAHCAAAYQQSILEQGDKAFDEAFMRRSFGRFWNKARHAVRFSNDLLAPAPAHVVATLRAAQTNCSVAARFSALFNDNADYTTWLADEQTALRYLDEVLARR